MAAPLALAQVATNSLGVWMEHHDFGVVALPSEVAHEFLWRNDTAATQHIRTVTTSCECLEVTAFSRTIAPAGEGRIDVKARTQTAGTAQWLVFAEVLGSPAPRVFSLAGTVTAATTNQFSQELVVEPRDLLRDPARLNELAFVDVRSQEKFSLGRIPRSLNLPLFTVKTKAFLKPHRLVLVNEGHDAATLLQECQRLQQFQFQSVQILAGGYRAWQQQGGAVEGADTRSPALSTLSAAEFYHAGSQPGWLVLHWGADEAWAGLFPASRALAGAADASALRLALEQATGPTQAVARILVVTRRGDGYGTLAGAVPQGTSSPVYFLAGGAEEYADFISRQMAMRNRREMTLAGYRPARYTHSPAPAQRTGGCCGGSR